MNIIKKYQLNFKLIKLFEYKFYKFLYILSETLIVVHLTVVLKKTLGTTSE